MCSSHERGMIENSKMTQVTPSHLTVLEWGICLLTILFCWRHYRIRSIDEVKKAMRDAYKKFKSVAFSENHKSYRPVNKTNGDEVYYHKLPTTKRSFFSRTVSKETDINGNEELNFPLNSQVVQLSRADGDKERCPACDACEKNLEEIKNRQNRKLRNVLDPVDLRKAENPFYIRAFAFLIHFWRKAWLGPCYHFPKTEQVMNDGKVQLAIQEAAKIEYDEDPSSRSLEDLIKKHTSRARSILVNMRAKQAKPEYFIHFVRIASWIIGKTLGLIYPQILVHQSQIEVLKQIRKTGKPIVYLPVHRSHMDYVFVSWILVTCDVRAPLVAAGDNLNIPIFSLMMKSVGGFFIKRKLDLKSGKRDVLYRALLRSYMERCIINNHDLEFFIEGGRTRTGKPCLPKGGLLSMVVDMLYSKLIEDVYIVPVNFTYEKLIEGNYVREQLGQPKVKENFFSAAIALWSSLQTKFGNARIDFGQPFSVREYIKNYIALRLPSPLSDARHFGRPGTETGPLCLPNGNLASNQRTLETMMDGSRGIVDSLAKHAIYDGMKSFTLMITNGIAFILLNKYREGTNEKTLSNELSELRVEILERGHDVGYTGTEEDIQHGLTVLGDCLVKKEVTKTLRNGNENFIKPVTMMPSVIDLSYYSNCVLPIYAMEAVIATSYLVMADEKVAVRIEKNELLDTCEELCDILQHEFIFKPPCKSLRSGILKTLERMLKDGIFQFEECEYETIPDLVKTSEVTTTKSIIIQPQGPKHVERLIFLKSLLRPIMDTYVVSCQVLKRLIGNEAPEKYLQMEILAEIKFQFQQNCISFGESLALDPVKNFLKLMTTWQVLKIHEKLDSTSFYISDIYDNDETITKVAGKVQRFRF